MYKGFQRDGIFLSRGSKGQKSFYCPGTKGQRDGRPFIVPGQRDNRTEVPSLSWDKGTTGQAQNLAKGQDVPGQPVIIWDGTRDGTVPDFDSLSFPVLWDKTGQRRKGRSKTRKGHSKTEKDVLKQEMIVLNRKMTF